MKTYLLALASLLLCLGTTASAQQLRPLPAGVLADKWWASAEWVGQAYISEGNNLLYALYWDDTTVHVFLHSNNRLTQRKMLFSGLTVWADPRGKNAHAYGLHYPAGEDIGILPSPLNSNIPPAEWSQLVARQLAMTDKVVHILKTTNQEYQQVRLPAPAPYTGLTGDILPTPEGTLLYRLSIPRSLLRIDAANLATTNPKGTIVLDLAIEGLGNGSNRPNMSPTSDVTSSAGFPSNRMPAGTTLPGGMNGQGMNGQTLNPGTTMPSQQQPADPNAPLWDFLSAGIRIKVKATLPAGGRQ